MNPAPSLRRLLARFALGVCLLALQQHAIAHWLSHAVAATHAKAPAAPATPASEHCADCDSLIAFEASPTAASRLLPLAPAFAQVPAEARSAAPPAATAPAAYRSRAPPSSR